MSSRRGRRSRARLWPRCCFSPPGERGGHAPQQMGDAQQFDGHPQGKDLRRFRGGPGGSAARRADFPARGGGGKAVRPERRIRFRAVREGDGCPVPRRNQISPSHSMRPASGFSSPAMQLIRVLLPEPEGPNSAQTERSARRNLHVQGKVSQAFAQGHGQHIVRQHSSW